jgi:hypothetical protein
MIKAHFSWRRSPHRAVNHFFGNGMGRLKFAMGNMHPARDINSRGNGNSSTPRPGKSNASGLRDRSGAGRRQAGRGNFDDQCETATKPRRRQTKQRIHPFHSHHSPRGTVITGAR